MDRITDLEKDSREKDQRIAGLERESAKDKTAIADLTKKMDNLTRTVTELQAAKQCVIVNNISCIFLEILFL